MNKLTKKFLTGITCAALVATTGVALTACGNDKKDDKPEDEIQQPAPETVQSVSNFAELTTAFIKGGKIKLTEDIVMTDAIFVTEEVTLDLNGHTITETIEDAQHLAVFFVYNHGKTFTVTGNGSIESNGTRIFQIGSDTTEKDGTETITNGNLVLQNGNYTVSGEAEEVLYVIKGTAKITGGTYKVNDARPGHENQAINLRNQYGSNGTVEGEKGTAAIEISGGVFYNFDPANSEDGNLLKDGYVVETTNDSTVDHPIYTVVANS